MKCIDCHQEIYFKPAYKAEKEGHVYSEAGRREVGITGFCEYCFDGLFTEPDKYCDCGNQLRTNADICADCFEHGCTKESHEMDSCFKFLNDERQRERDFEEKGGYYYAKR